MKNLLAAALLLFFAGPARADDWDAARPVYRGFERVADRFYGLMRGHLFSAVLPGRLSRRMSATPAASSDAVFARRMARRQDRARVRILEARPLGQASTPAALAVWRDTALSAQTAAVTDALADTLVTRYELERFGQDSGRYALDPRNWDAEFLASATVLGGAYLYAAGLRADWTAGAVRVDLDSPAGSALASAARSGEGRLVELRLSPRSSPLSLKSAWGLRRGRLASEQVGLAYTTRF
ncbi:MAG: hypothetical protein SF051_07615 [Elusimicrobiota bacterium]|nr:hypothetical protein [Elusimicrobiota bacterium]